VTLMEKEGELGGIVGVLANNSLNSEFRNLIDFLSVQMRKLKVDVRVCKEATADDIMEFGPDVVILATGSTMSIPKKAQGKLQVMTHVEALRNKGAVGKRVVIHGLGYGSELAISLAEEGKEVILFGKGEEIATNIPPLRRVYILKRLTDINLRKGDGDLPIREEGNPRVLTERTLVDVTPEGVVMEDKEGEKETLSYDTFIISMGRRKNDQLFEELKDKVPEIYQVGDCEGIGEIWEAMRLANQVGKQV